MPTHFLSPLCHMSFNRLSNSCVLGWLHTVRFLANPGKRWPLWEKRGDIFGPKTLVQCCPFRQVQGWTTKLPLFHIFIQIHSHLGYTYTLSFFLLCFFQIASTQSFVSVTQKKHHSVDVLGPGWPITRGSCCALVSGTNMSKLCDSCKQDSTPQEQRSCLCVCVNDIFWLSACVF